MSNLIRIKKAPKQSKFKANASCSFFMNSKILVYEFFLSLHTSHNAESGIQVFH